MNIRIGTDIVYIPRIKSALERFGDRFLERVYTSTEQQDCWQPFADRAIASGIAKLAGRWAAKEAIVKALGTGWRDIRYVDVEIQRTANGAPQVCLHRRAAVIAAQQGNGQWQLSLSHDTDYAIATAIFFSHPSG
ncbi:holo-ACP synthase [Leptolyngbya sp. AN02str]|uniref:holo-ACP synthase n=1 Tax=Leptolyngbya sp. AN02str TaxID=3423363 RepID=UPI003D318B36